MTLLCSGQVSVNVRFFDGGFTGTEVGSVDLGSQGSDGCGQSFVVTGIGKADFYRAAYQAPTGGQFTNSVLPGKGATDQFILNGTVLATLIIK